MQILIAFHDAQIKYQLTCFPEPPEGEVLEGHRSRARARYEKFVRSMSHNLAAGNLNGILAELMTNAERARS